MFLNSTQSYNKVMKHQKKSPLNPHLFSIKRNSMKFHAIIIDAIIHLLSLYYFIKSTIFKNYKNRKIV